MSRFAGSFVFKTTLFALLVLYSVTFATSGDLLMGPLAEEMMGPCVEEVSYFPGLGGLGYRVAYHEYENGRRTLVAADESNSLYVYIFNNTGDEWLLTQTFTTTTKYETLLMTGTTLFAANPLDDAEYGVDSGAVFIYVVNDITGNFTQTQKLIGPMAFDKFGSTIALYETTLAVLSPFDDDAGPDIGAVFLYEETMVGFYTQTHKLLPADVGANELVYVSRAALAIDSDTIVLGVPTSPFGQTGKVVIWSEDLMGDWHQQEDLYAFDATFASYYQDGATFKAKFGNDVALKDETLVVGQFHDDQLDYRGGAVYVFQEMNNTWGHLQKIFTPDVGYDEGRFGYLNVLQGDLLFISEYRGSITGESPGYQGAVWVFVREGPGELYTQLARIEGSVMDSDAYTRFGYSFAVMGSTIVIGAPGRDPGGAIYVMGDKCQPCYNGGDAFFLRGCGCIGTGHIGLNCEIPCENGGLGPKLNNTEQCNCTGTHYKGQYCENPCYNGFSSVADDFLECDCNGSGATGNSCQHDIDDCMSSPCLNNGECSDMGTEYFPQHAHEFNCSCADTGYHGVICNISNCESSPCDNGGTCSNVEGGIVCNCSAIPYEGIFCEIETDECESSPCLNEGNCIDQIGSFKCNCTNDYAGTYCDIINCQGSLNPCLNGGTCTQTYNLGIANGSWCNCDSVPYNGAVCEIDIDDCESSPCKSDSQCTDLVGGYDCYAACMSSPCLNNGTCYNEKDIDNYTCICDDFYEGVMCEHNIDDCVTNACQNEALCVDGLGSYSCNCTTPGYEGVMCEHNIDDCVTNACQNEALCVDGLGSYSCNCTTPGYEGDFCDININDCASNPCLNDGTCIDLLLDFFCECALDFEGELCQHFRPSNATQEEVVFEFIVTGGFVRANDTAESFAIDLAVLLSETIPSTRPEDYTITVTSADGDTIVYSISIKLDEDDEDPDLIIQSIEESVPIQERLHDPVKVRVVEDEEHSEKKKKDDLTWLIVLLVFLSVAGIAAAGYGAKVYHERQGASIFKSYKLKDKTSVPV